VDVRGRGADSSRRRVGDVAGDECHKPSLGGRRVMELAFRATCAVAFGIGQRLRGLDCCENLKQIPTLMGFQIRCSATFGLGDQLLLHRLHCFPDIFERPCTLVGRVALDDDRARLRARRSFFFSKPIYLPEEKTYSSLRLMQIFYGVRFNCLFHMREGAPPPGESWRCLRMGRRTCVALWLVLVGGRNFWIPT
jgi:hypothetical protein